MLFRTRDHRGLDGDLQAGGDRRRTRSRAGAERRMAALRLSCLARNGRSPGEESLSAAIAAQAIEAQPSSGQISQGEAVVARRTASSGEDVADPEGPAQGSRHSRRRERGPSVGKGRHHTGGQPVQRQHPQPSGLRWPRRDRGRLVAAVEGGSRLSLPQARRPELRGTHLRQPVR